MINRNNNYIFETSEKYKVNTNEVVINKKKLSPEASIQYLLNEKEQLVSGEIKSLIDKDPTKLKEYLTQFSSRKIDNLPLQLSLIVNESLMKYKNEITKDFQLLESKLITNDHTTGDYLINHLKNELLTCDSFDIIVSFIKGSGLNMLVNTLEILKERGVKGRIITSTYMNVTEPEVLRKLNNNPNIGLKVYQSDKNEDSFHTKAYIFHRKNQLSSVIIGSSNITKAAFKTGEEWNIRTYERASDAIYERTTNRFNNLWKSEKTISINDSFIIKYQQFLEDKNILRPYLNSFNQNLISKDSNDIVPNSMQRAALTNLMNSISNGHTRGIAIAATGTGKTYLAAMAAKQLEPKNVLFIAHRTELLNGALKTFKSIFSDELENNFNIYKADRRDIAKFTFASVQSLANDFTQYEKDQFDIIFIDEFHHATASNYMKIINYYKPRFLLGLTATPERTDGGDIYELAEYNVISDVRLKHALDSELLVPFQYYGISDETVQLADKQGITEEQITQLLSTNRRVDFIIEKMSHYTLSGTMRCLAFCQNVKHAEYMNEEFNKRGIVSTILTGSNKDIERSDAIDRLKDENDPLEVIFTVDLFNEGTDIPQVNLILFLRPTESAIIFTQQLGRGLRLNERKEYLVVLDFVTNDRKSYLVPIALAGNEKHLVKERLKSLVENNFNDLSRSIHIELDYKTKEKILASIDQQNFYSAQFIKKEAKEFLEVIRLETKDNERKLSILDFHSHENAPSLSFIFNGTYNNIATLNKAIDEQREVDKEIVNNKLLIKIFDEITKYLPVVQIYDLVILLRGLLNKSTDIDDTIHFLEESFSIKLNDIAKTNIKYAFKRVSDTKIEGKTLFKKEDDHISHSLDFSSMIQNELKEHLTFVLLNYRSQFDPEKLNEKINLKLYSQYTRKEIATLVGYDKDISSWRDGVKQFEGNHYLFINLKKDEEKVEERLLYDDYFISEDLFHWQSQNKTSIDSKTGQEYIHHKKNGKKIFLFVRRSSSEDNVTLPFYYLGEVDFVSAQGSKPISIEWQLHHSVPKYILDELEY